jgi:stage II sporulation protein D (peptidoglycan lytic transglycosylase)
MRWRKPDPQEAARRTACVALSPSNRPERGIVVLLPGGAGRDAAKIAADVLRAPATPVAAAPPAVQAAGRGRSSASGAPASGTASSTPAAQGPNRSRLPAAVAQGAGPVSVDPRGSHRAPAPETSVSLPRTVRVGFTRVSGGYDVRTMPFEDYVARVVAGEAAIRSPEAALDALAITVRTFAAANMGRHAREGFDLCDLTHCQVVRAATDATRAAAERTRGEVLQYRGAPASVFYTASCGGRSEVPSAVWPGASDPPFLPLRTDPACGDGPAWSAEIAASDLVRALRASGFKGGTLRDLRVVSRTSSGRAAVIQIAGLTPPTISGQDFRVALGRTLGWNLIKSAAFDVKRTAQGYRFAGKGSGHGVGLCVIGSVQMALSGASPAAILATYFPGLSARGSFASAPAAPANVKVWLSGADEPQRAFIENLAQHLWTSITLRASIRAVGGVTLRFHPTVESYRRATGQPWWVAATTHATDIQLLPASVLRDRGVLEQTMAHEIAHVVSAPLLAGRAPWIQEGAAMYLAGEKPGVMPARVKCPGDAELSRSTSPGALRDAYARAGACFAARVAAGEDWRAIK